MGSRREQSGCAVLGCCLVVAHCRDYQAFRICSLPAPWSRILSLAEQVPELTKVYSSEIQDYHLAFCFALVSVDPDFYHR